MTDNQKHWDLLITNAHLATMADAACGLLRDGAVAVAGGKIAWVGPMGALPHRNAARVVDAKGQWLTPGLIDCHTHLVYGGNRADEFAQRLKGKTYKEIAEAGGGIRSTVRATRAASEQELFDVSAQRLQQFLREGVTTTEIKSGYGLDLASETKMLRVARRLGEQFPVTVRTTFLGAHTVPEEYHGRSDDYVQHICDEMLPAIAKAKLADAVDGFCESIGFSAAQMERIFAKAKELGLAVKLHAEQLSDSGGAALAARFGALSADHLEHASEAGIAAMAKASTVAVLLPGAFYMLRETHLPPVEMLRNKNVPIALASDCNPGTSPITSLLLMINMGCVLFRLTPEEALLGVTRHAAAALGLQKTKGVLAVGMDADLALWAIAHPFDLAYHAGFNPCRAVVQNGAWRDIQP